MVSKENNNEYLQVLNRIFQPLGRILRRYQPPLPVFFLTLQPITWQISYYGAVAHSQPAALQNNERDARFKEEVSNNFIKMVDTYWKNRRDSWTGMDNCVERLGSIYKKDPEAFKATLLEGVDLQDSPIQKVSSTESIVKSLLNYAAVAILSGQNIELGCEGGGPELSPWAWERIRTPQKKWFQEALDYACTFKLRPEAYAWRFGGSKKKMQEQHAFYVPFKDIYSDEDRNLVFCVKNYLKRPGLVKEDTFIPLLAEYFYSQEGDLNSKVLPSGQSHYFLLLRGLGQWRAAICWLDKDTAAPPAYVSAVLGAAVRDLYSKSLIDYFGLKLSGALTSERQQRERMIREAFTTLWWAYEICFYRGDKCVMQLCRDVEGVLRPQCGEEGLKKANDFERRDRFLMIEPRSDKHESPLQGRRIIHLNLNRIGDKHQSEGNNHAQIALGFDYIRYKVDLLEERGEDLTGDLEIHYYETNLRERILELLSLHNARLSKKLAEGAYSTGHPLKDRAGIARKSYNGIYSFRSYLPDHLKDDYDARLKELNARLKSIENIGLILDAISFAIGKDKGEEAFLKDDRFSEEKYDIAEAIERIYRNNLAEIESEIYMNEDELQSLLVTTISPWIIHKERGGIRIRPKDEYYDEIFSEIFYNISKHGKPESINDDEQTREKVRAYIRHEEIHYQDDTFPCIVISNICKKNVDPKKLGLVPGKWRAWEGRVQGSITFISKFLYSTETGRLFVKLDNVDGRNVFAIGLHFK